MTPPSGNLYAQWRAHSGAPLMLRDHASPPPEHLLQAIWQHQRLHRDQLRTLDGKVVRVLHPGFGNAEGGPDFRDALIQIGDATPRTGDVEVDLVPAGWRAHGHDRNPNFKNVILHVIWDSPGSRRREAGESAGPVAPPPGGSHEFAGPTLPLCKVLDAPLDQLSLWLEREPVKTLPEDFRGKCSAPLRELSSEALGELLREAALVRLQAKAAHFSARARHVGWEQALWEGLFRALGYKHNSWAMQSIAETRARWLPEAKTPLMLQARLLGIGGLLPAENLRKRSATDDYLRRVWDWWWRERDQFADCALPAKIWRLHGLRPANHPQRRVALAAHWLFTGALPAQLEQWCAATIPEKMLPASLHKILAVERDDYWSWHWTFRSPRLKKAQPLLGATRAADLAMNVILPWLWTRAKEGGNEKLRREMEQRYFVWPAAEDNSVLRRARQRLLAGAGRNGFRIAAAQQGLLQIVRDFCDHSNAACEGCQFPELVKSWKVE